MQGTLSLEQHDGEQVCVVGWREGAKRQCACLAVASWQRLQER